MNIIYKDIYQNIAEAEKIHINKQNINLKKIIATMEKKRFDITDDYNYICLLILVYIVSVVFIYICLYFQN